MNIIHIAFPEMNETVPSSSVTLYSLIGRGELDMVDGDFFQTLASLCSKETIRLGETSAIISKSQISETIRDWEL